MAMVSTIEFAQLPIVLDLRYWTYSLLSLQMKLIILEAPVPIWANPMREDFNCWLFLQMLILLEMLPRISMLVFYFVRSYNDIYAKLVQCINVITLMIVKMTLCFKIAHKIIINFKRGLQNNLLLIYPNIFNQSLRWRSVLFCLGNGDWWLT